ncbi:MAG: hypothetical protein GY711_32465 [bacterium]|nr:hypothetical protein [bacterium]
MSIATLFLLASLPAVGDIAWQSSLDAARTLAAEESRVVFVAVNMDGERANERMLAEVYTDKRVRELAEQTVNVIASNDVHAKEGRECKRFGGMTCKEHRFVDAAVREEILKPDDDGFVVAPQHVFLDAAGEVLLSVPYEVSARELEWCFVTALQTANPDSSERMSSKARPPRRLILGGVWEAKGAALLKREEALALIEELKKGMRGEEARRNLRRLATADEPEAREYVLSILRSSGGGGRRGGGRGDRDRRGELLRWIGASSPRSYWEVAVEFLNGEEAMRQEAIVALEQLAAPESLGDLLARLKREKDERATKNLLRAIGASGYADKRARRMLLSRAGDARQEAPVRKNAIVALGFLTSHDDVTAFLRETLEGEERIAAVVAIGLTRDAGWKETLEERLKDAGDEKRALEAALAVLGKGDLGKLEGVFRGVTGDEIPRERLFGG